MNITLIPYTGTLDEENLNGMQHPMPPKVGHLDECGMGTQSIYKADDVAVGDTPYGKVIRFSERTVRVSAGAVKSIVEHYVQEHQRTTGEIMYGAAHKQLKNTVVQMLKEQQMPTDASVYVVLYMGYAAVCTSSARKVASVCYYLEHAGLTLERPIHCSPEQVDALFHRGEIYDAKVTGPVTMSNAQGKFVTVSYADPECSEITDLLAQGYAVVSFFLDNSIGTFGIINGQLQSAKLTPDALRTLQPEWIDAPEFPEVLRVAATVATTVLDFAAATRGMP